MSLYVILITQESFLRCLSLQQVVLELIKPTHDLGKTQQRSMLMVLNNVKGFGFGHTHLGFEITSNLMEF